MTSPAAQLYVWPVRLLLLVEDIVVGRSGIVLLPAVDRDSLHIGVGDVVDLVAGEQREEVEVLGLEVDRNPARVRLRIATTAAVGPGVEVWPSQSESRVVVKRRASGLRPTLSSASAASDVVVHLSGAVAERRRR
jgi:bifunctional DNA-binding transcriptional regulator/antitoxin component of YhaV-PrlF toxin-antitoxin module